jgi:enoyl-CoA hydratase
MIHSERNGPVELLMLDRAHVRNALDNATLAELLARLAALEEDPDVRAIVLTGKGNTFAVGVDLHELRETKTLDQAAHLSDVGHELCARIEEIHIPVICALSGPAIGAGAELAIACDMRIAEPTATLSFRHVRLGVTSAWGAAARLVSAAGPGTASRLLLTAQEIPAEEALRIGLVDAVSAPGQSIALAHAWAADVALGAPEAVGQMKALLLELRRSPTRVRTTERDKFISSLTSREHAEAMEAWVMKRPARWH